MSDGKKFGIKTELTTEERLNEIERKYEFIQQRIQSYNQTLSEFSELKKEHESLKSYCGYLEHLTEKEAQNILGIVNKVSNSLDQHKKENSSEIDIIKHNVKEWLNNCIQGNRKFDSIIEQQNQLSELVKENQKKHESLYAAVTAQGISYKNQKETISDSSKRIDDLVDQHNNFKTSLFLIDRSIEKSKNECTSLIDKIPDFRDWAAKIYSKSGKDLQNLSESLHSKIDTGISNVRAELKEDPLTVESVKKEFKKYLETLALDSRNAYLKAENHTKQITLIEKKLENINLQIKKYEIDK